jgi:hypothetical protein
VAIQESLAAIVIAGVALASVVQVLTLAAAQRRVGTQRAVAAQEAGNLMEELMSRPWEELTAERVADVALSARCLRYVPEARLRIDVTEEEQTAVPRRIDIRIDWPQPAGQAGRPVRLVAWRYPHEETDR